LNHHKAVILGCNYFIGLSAIRCLGIHGIHTVAVDYAQANTFGAESKYCSERLTAPHYKEDPQGFIQFLKDYASKQNVPPVLIPCHDSYVEIVDEYLDELRSCFLIPQTEAGLYTKLMNKETLEKLAVEAGVAVPETVRVDEENFIDKVEQIIKYPCMVKPTDSPSFVAKFRVKIFLVNNSEELLQAVENARQAGLEVIIQRIIPGFDDHMYTFDAYSNQDAKVVQWVTCQKFRQFPINFGQSVYTTQRYVPELYDIGARFLEKIGYKGFSEIEFKKDPETGNFYLIEVNVRITTLNVMLNKVGMNVPYITYLELTGGTVPPFALRENTRRTFHYLYEDILAVRDYKRTGQLTIGQVVKSLFRPKSAAIWDWKDPKPGFVFTKMVLGKVLGRIIGRRFKHRAKTPIK